MLESDDNMKVLLQLPGSEPPNVYDTGRVDNAPFTYVAVHTLATHVCEGSHAGEHAGTTVGATVGATVGTTVGTTVGATVGTTVGATVGTTGTAGDVHAATPDVVTHVCGSTHAGEHAGVRR